MSVFIDIRNAALSSLEACSTVRLSPRAIDRVAVLLSERSEVHSKFVERYLLQAPVMWDSVDAQIDFQLYYYLLQVGTGFSKLLESEVAKTSDDVVLFFLLSLAMDGAADRRLGSHQLAEQTARSVADATGIPMTKEVEAIPNSPVYTDVPHPLATYCDRVAVAASNIGRVLRGVQVEHLSAFIRRHAERARAAASTGREGATAVSQSPSTSSASSAPPGATMLAVADALRNTFPPFASDPFAARLCGVLGAAWFAFRGVVKASPIPRIREGAFPLSAAGTVPVSGAQPSAVGGAEDSEGVQDARGVQHGSAQGVVDAGGGLEGRGVTKVTDAEGVGEDVASRFRDDDANEDTLFSSADLAAIPAMATSRLVEALVRLGVIRVHADSVTCTRLKGLRSFHSGGDDEKALRGAVVVAVDLITRRMIELGVGGREEGVGGGLVAPCAVVIGHMIAKMEPEMQKRMCSGGARAGAVACSGDSPALSAIAAKGLDGGSLSDGDVPRASSEVAAGGAPADLTVSPPKPRLSAVDGVQPVESGGADVKDGAACLSLLTSEESVMVTASSKWEVMKEAMFVCVDTTFY